MKSSTQMLQMPSLTRMHVSITGAWLIGDTVERSKFSRSFGEGGDIKHEN
jgi:hypothetical protein